MDCTLARGGAGRDGRRKRPFLRLVGGDGFEPEAEGEAAARFEEEADAEAEGEGEARILVVIRLKKPPFEDEDKAAGGVCVIVAAMLDACSR